jgi:hypothetical protein
MPSSSFALLVAVLGLLSLSAVLADYISWDTVKARAGKKAASELRNSFINMRYYVRPIRTYCL